MTNWWDSLGDFFYDVTHGPVAALEVPTQEPQTTISNSPVQAFLQSAGGGIAQGLETGFVSFVKDIWDVIVGPVEVVVGVLIMAFAVGLILNNDLAAATTRVIR